MNKWTFDQNLPALSDEEIKAEILAAFGAWANREDITDDWLEELRRGWVERLDEIYGNQSKNSNL